MKLFSFIRKKERVTKGETENKESPIRENTKAYATDSFIEPEYEQLSYDQIANLYQRSSLLKKYIKIIIDECLRYKLRALPKNEFKDDDQAKKRADEINHLLFASNKIDTFRDVREKYLKDLLLYGRAGIELQPTEGDKVDAIYAVPGYAIRLDVDKTGANFKDPSKAYKLLNPNDLDKVVATFAYDSLIYLIFDNISDRIYGDAPIDSIRTELITDINTSKQVQVSVNSLKAGVLVLPKAPRGLLKDITTKLIQLVKGNARAKVVAVNTASGDFLDMSNLTPKESIELQQWLAKRANVFNIPPFKLGLSDDTGSLNAREQKDDFRALIESIVEYEIDKFNTVLLHTRLKYNNIEIICPNFATKLQYEQTRIAVRLVNGKIITPNEARETYLGLPKLEDPQADKLQISESQTTNVDKEQNLTDEAAKVQQMELAEKKKELIDNILANQDNVEEEEKKDENL